jgi:hypothetical protein
VTDCFAACALPASANSAAAAAIPANSLLMTQKLPGTILVPLSV